MYMLREENKISFFRVYNYNIGSDCSMRDGSQIAVYYSGIFGLLGKKSYSHFLRASSLDCYPMKPNMGLVRLYRLLLVMGILRAALEGGCYEQEEEAGCS
jgi:hypothetical protein